MKIRFARHTHDLKSIEHFYCNLLGLELTGYFNNHEGYDGVFISQAGENWELEFTVSKDQPASIPDDDDLIIFYPDKNNFDQMIDRLMENDQFPVDPKNPYWMENGCTYRDPDGFRIVIVKQRGFQ